MLFLTISVTIIPFNFASAEDCDFRAVPKAPVNFSSPPTPGHVLFKDGCHTTFGTYGDPRCATLSPKGGSIIFWKFYKEMGTKDRNDDTTKEPTANDEYQLAARGDLNTLSEGQGNFIYRNKKDPLFYYTIEKNKSTDVGMLDAIQATSHFRVGKDLQYKTFNTMSYDNIWDIYNNSDKCDPHLPTLESGVESNSQRYLWRLVSTGHVTLNGEPLSGRANVSMLLSDKNGPVPEATDSDPNPKAFPGGPILDTVPTDTDGNFEFSRKYEAGKGLGNEEIWLNTNVEKKVVLDFQFTANDGAKYESFLTLDFDKDFVEMSESSDEVKSNTKKTRVIDFDFTDNEKVVTFSRDLNSTGTSGFLGNDENSDICPSASWTNPGTWFKSSLCGLGLALHYAGKKFTTFSMDQLKIVLGLTSPNANYEKDMGY